MHYLPAKNKKNKKKNRKRIQIIVQLKVTRKIDLQNISTKKHILLSLNHWIGKICDVVFSRTTIHAKPQNLMSWTFKYSFTNAQDFCARKGNKISLSYYWIISIYMVQKCWYICGWNAFAIFTKGHPFPLALIHMISSRLRPFFVWRSAKIFIALSHSVS